MSLRRTLMPLLALIFVLLFPIASYAASTPAGTVVSNIATLAYSVGGVPAPYISSAAATFTVDELIDVTLTWQNGAPVSVNSPDTNTALTFLLTNTSNGSAGAIFLENGLAPGFQSSGPNADTLYVSGSNDPNLAAGTSQIVYVVSNTPAALVNGNTGNVALSAASLTPGAAGAAPGTSFPGLGQGGTTAVVGATQVPGSVLTYHIVVTLSGSGTATNLVITDPMPAQVTYLPGSITLGGTARTDAADADNANFSANTVTVTLGTLIAPTSTTITFQATVN